MACVLSQVQQRGKDVGRLDDRAVGQVPVDVPFAPFGSLLFVFFLKLTTKMGLQRADHRSRLQRVDLALDVLRSLAVVFALTHVLLVRLIGFGTSGWFIQTFRTKFLTGPSVPKVSRFQPEIPKCSDS